MTEDDVTTIAAVFYGFGIFVATAVLVGAVLWLTPARSTARRVLVVAAVALMAGVAAFLFVDR